MERREKPRVGRVLVYGLLDPRDATLRYVGKTHKRREVRLAEHLERAAEGSALPVHRWVRELTKQGLAPVVFVLRRVPPTADWRLAERSEIERWRNWPSEALPYVHPAQTPKSVPVEIRAVALLNVPDGG